MSGHLNLSMALNVLFVLQSELELFKEAATLLFWFDRIVISLNEQEDFIATKFDSELLLVSLEPPATLDTFL